MKAYKAALSLILAAWMSAAPALAEGEGVTETENTAPVAENQQLETYRGVSVGGQLSAYDAEGDELTFEITTQPMKGVVELTADGHFIYTPRENKRGKDYFGFRAADSAGNVSQEGTVIIKLVKQRSSVTYSDLEGDAVEYAAIVLTENGVFTGEYVGTDYVFRPDVSVSRGEFLSMCMTASGCELLKGVSSTGFQDDDSIGAWLKPYVATALMRGYIRGTAAENGAVFRPEDAVTLREACIMLNAVLGITDVVSVASYIDPEGWESWQESESAQAVANLTASGVMPAGLGGLDAPIDRADAAQLLLNAIRLLARRGA